MVRGGSPRVALEPLESRWLLSGTFAAFQTLADAPLEPLAATTLSVQPDAQGSPTTGIALLDQLLSAEVVTPSFANTSSTLADESVALGQAASQRNAEVDTWALIQDDQASSGIVVLEPVLAADSQASAAGESTADWNWQGALAIPDGPNGAWVGIDFAEPTWLSANAIVTQVQLRHKVSHTWIGDLEVTLANADHTWLVRDNVGGSSVDFDETASELALFDGDAARQQWSYRIRDTVLADVGTLDELELWVYYDAPEADLHVPLIVWSGTAQEGQPVEIQAEVRNLGAVSAGASHVKAWLSIDNDFDTTDDYYLGELPVAALAQDQSDTAVWSFNMPDLGVGTYTAWVLVEADSQAEVIEASEQNLFASGQGITVEDSTSQLGQIQGVIWNDVNGDAVRDLGDDGLEGWRAYIDQNANGQWDVGEPFALTDIDGNYLLDAVPSGVYIVAEEVQPGWQQTYPAPAGGGASSAGDGASEPAASNQQIDTSSARATPDPLAGITSEQSQAAATVTGWAVFNNDISVSPALAQSGPLVNMVTFRNDPRFSAVDGSGYAAVILDTGIDLDHPYFGPDADGDGVADRIVFNQDFTSDQNPNAQDGHGHGSNVSSIIASENSTNTGMAPGVDIIALKVLRDDGSGTFGDIEIALQWVIANAATYNIASVNMSLTDGVNWNVAGSHYGLGDELATLASMDIMVISASGNDFYAADSVQGVGYPSADPNSLSIGAVFDADIGGVSYNGGAQATTTDADRITPFSQRHEQLSTIFAPGAKIRGANANGGTVIYHGTSQASPHVAGIVVLAQQLADQYLGRRLTIDEMTTLLRSSAVTINDGDDEDDNVTNTALDFTRVDMFALAEAIIVFSGAGTYSVSVGQGEVVTGIDFGNTTVNSLPTANDDPFTIDEDSGTINFDVLANDSTAPDVGETLTITAVGVGSNGGTIAISGGGGGTSIDYAPAANFNGIETFTYTINDGTPASDDTATVTVTVDPINDPPTANDDLFSVEENSGTTNLDVLADDSIAPDSGETLTITAVGIGPAGGTIAIAGGGTSIDYTPAADFSGAETFTYTINDGTPGSDATATVTMTINALPQVQGPQLRTGVITNVDGTWQTLTLDATYTSMVVLLTANYDATSVPLVPRVRNATGNSFELRVDRADKLSDPVAGVSVHYLVVEEGVYTQAEDGVTLEAVKFTSTVTDIKRSWVGESRSYANTYTNPVVLGQVMTTNDEAWSVFWAHGSSKRYNPPTSTSLSVGKHVGADRDTTRADETIGYVVLESGSGTISGRQYIAALGADTIRGVDDAAPFTYAPLGTVADSTAIVSAAGMDSNDGGWPILYGVDPVALDTLNLAIDEDRMRDTERSHPTEQVAYILFAPLIRASIGDLVWDDLNGDGIQDVGEPGIDGVTVNLLDGAGAGLTSTTTANGGQYLFDNLDAGAYIVAFELPAGYTFTLQDAPGGTSGGDAIDSDADPTTGWTAVLTVVDGQDDDTVDAGLVALGEIQGTKWEDLNGDGLWDQPGELGLAGVTVYLDDNFDGQLDWTDGNGNSQWDAGEGERWTLTAADGSYSFADVVPGTYNVAEVVPIGYEQTYPRLGWSDEFLVNQYTSGHQQRPTITHGADGSFVIAWESDGQAGGVLDVYARRYDSVGQALGDEFLVNQYTDSDQSFSRISHGADGSFVITWTSTGQDGDGTGVYARRYDSAGQALGGEFQVNQYTSSGQQRSTISHSGDGSFVIAWDSFGQDGSSEGVYARRYDSAGQALGDEFQVNQYTDSPQEVPTISHGADGSFVIAWDSTGQDGSSDGVYARRYGSAGQALGNEFQVNQYTINSQWYTKLSHGADGGFVITWGSEGQDGSEYAVYARRYDSNGQALGDEFQVNQYTSNDQSDPTISHGADGGFVIAWRSDIQDGSGSGVYARRYDSNGQTMGDEFQVNQYTDSSQLRPTISQGDDGSLVITWDSYGQDDSGYGVYARRYAARADHTVWVGPRQIVQGIDFGNTILNNPPTANDDPFTVNEDSGTTNLDVLADDSSAPDVGETLTIIAVGAGSNGGTISIAGGGTSIDYTPAPDFNGVETFTYTINDGTPGSDATATVTVTVDPVNDLPTANDDAFTVNQDSGTTNFDVLADDSTLPDTGETLTIIAVGAGSAGGTIAIAGAGISIDYAPAPDFNGVETFTYTINDGTPGSDATATVTVTVDPVIEPPVGSGPQLRTGVVSGVDTTWQTVTLDATYTSMVVVLTANYDATSVPLATRVRNAGGNSFEVRVDRADKLAGPVAGVSVHYMVVEEGVYTEAEDGIKLEAVTFTSTVTDGRNSWIGQSRSYANTYTSPVVVGQVLTTNDEAFSVFWTHGGLKRYHPPSTTSLWVGKHVGSDSARARADETIGYVVIEAGGGTINGQSYIAGLGADTILGVDDAAPFSYAPIGATAGSTAVLSSAAMDANDGGWPILYGLDPIALDTLNLAIDEDRMRDAERSHATEQAAYIVFAPAGGAAAVVDVDEDPTPGRGDVGLTAASATGGPTGVLGPSDNIALDQPKVVFGLEDPANPGVVVGPLIFNEALLDTGANGVLLGNLAYYNNEFLLDPNLYQVARNNGQDVQYEEIGVAGTQLLDVLAEYDLNFAGTDYFDVKLVENVRALGDHTIDLGGFPAIVGMPAMIDRVTHLDLTTMLDENIFSITETFLEQAPTPPPNSLHVDLTMLPVEFLGQADPTDPLPTFIPLPLIEGVTTTHNGLSTTSTALLDTGAQLSIISTQTALAMNIDPILDAVDFIAVGGIGGIVEVPLVEVSQLTLPTAEGVTLAYTDLVVAVIDIPGIGSIFGMDLLTSGYFAPFIDVLLGQPAQDYGYYSEIVLDFTGSSASGTGQMVLSINPNVLGFSETRQQSGTVTVITSSTGATAPPAGAAPGTKATGKARSQTTASSLDDVIAAWSLRKARLTQITPGGAGALLRQVTGAGQAISFADPAADEPLGFDFGNYKLSPIDPS